MKISINHVKSKSGYILFRDVAECLSSIRVERVLDRFAHVFARNLRVCSFHFDLSCQQVLKKFATLLIKAIIAFKNMFIKVGIAP